MLRSLYTAATGMEAQQLKMDVISNNLANTNTTAFKRVRAEFEDLLSETLRGAEAPDPRGGTSPTPLQVGLGVRTGSTSRTFTLGDIQNTNQQLDLAIQGDGFFRVIKAGGEIGYTRAGNFKMDSTGRLVTANGELIDPDVNVPLDTTEVRIRPDGTVLARLSTKEEFEEIGALELTTFANPGGLEAIGGNLYMRTEASGDAIQVRPGEQGTGTILQGALEGANVKAVEEMIDMITTQRAYELNSKVIQTADQMLQKLTNLR